ncbi:MAG: SMC-Scp complex subunit ScpB [Candidatus Parabeggiatoa sp. nov. 3]|nr:MAG: SMC-Scp complex subunit ScpB [Gammaproteobacteria bacterium]HEW98614.1 SMC-Scp complex subunit ScpB [Beggiatoa sp.]
MPPLKFILEAALFAADKPLNLDHLVDLFTGPEQPERSLIRAALRELRDDYTERGIELMQVASGYRFQTQESLIPWLKRLQPERAPRYSRALLETLAIIAYRQPITRSEIEKIRGISVSTDLVKRLLDYNWIRILAHRDSPGRPALYGTTRTFLDYFNLKNLSDLPTLIELQEMVLPSDIFESDSESEGPEQNEETLDTKDNENTKGDIEEPDSKENPIQVITEEVQTTSNDTPTSEASSINVIVERLENEMEGKEEKTGTTDELETGTEIKPTTDVLNSESKDQTEAENVDEQLILFQEPANKQTAL